MKKENRLQRLQIYEQQNPNDRWSLITINFRNVKYWLLDTEMIVYGIEDKRMMREYINSLKSDKHHALWVNE